MEKFIALFIILTFSHLSFAKELKVEVDDCGPLARGELGVVFSLKPHGKGKGYFAKGSAYEVCPKLTKAKYVIGYEEDYCKNHKPFDKNECGVIKVFVIQKYIFE